MEKECNCHICKYRAKAGTNTVHSRCNHDVVDMILSDHDCLGIIFDNFSKHDKVSSGFWGFNIQIEEGAVANGWGYWPFNFDPRWVTSCSGFTPKED